MVRDVLGGAVVGKNDLLEEVNGVIRTLGNSMSPFNAWIFLKGLETLSLRMKAHCASAQILAEWLKQHDKVEKVYYAGLPDHPGHELAKNSKKVLVGLSHLL
jgi:O-succinylhomoserine sulfhydrylase